MKKILSYLSLAITGLLMAACSEDFKDWASQKTYDAESAITIPGFSASSAGAVDLNKAESTVKLINLNGTLPEGSSIDHVRFTADLNGTGEQLIEGSGDGYFDKGTLQKLIADAFGMRPVAREFEAHVYADVMVNGQGAYVDAGEVTLSIAPEAPVISANYYLVGGKLEWAESAASKAQKFSHSDKDVYEDPVFTIVIDAAEGDTWFAFGDDAALDAITNDGDWTKLFGTKGNSTDTSGSFDYRYNLGGDNSFCVPAGSKLIKVSINMLDYTYTIQPVNISQDYYLIGGPGEWSAESAMTMPFSHSDKDVVADPVFTYVFDGTGSDMWFAFGDKEAIDAVAAGDWTKLFGTKGESTDLSGSFDYRYNLDGDHSFCVDGTAKQYRVVINAAEMTYTITPLNFSETFYEIGNESGWATSHTLFGAAGDGKYQGYYYLDGEFKFKPNADNWDNDLEYVSGDTTSGTLTDAGGPNCPDPGAGFYRIDLDAAGLTYSLKKIESVSIIGTANGNWDTDTDLTYNKEEGCWEVTTELNAGEFKFRGNHNWDGDVDLGGTIDNLVHGGANIGIMAGNYTIKLYISYAGKNYCTITKN